MAEDVVAGTGTPVPSPSTPAPSPAFEATSRRSLLPRINARRGSARQSMHPELEPLLRAAGAEVAAFGVLLELAALGGRERLADLPVLALRTL